MFDSCMMYHGYKDADNRYPDSRAMRMTDCDLRGMKFVKCVMNGVDFTQTNLEGCTFKDCIMENCIFSEEQRLNINIQKTAPSIFR